MVGATGVVGETILRVLEERAIPLERLGAFASRARSGALSFRNQTLDVFATNDAALHGYDVVFFASSEDASATHAPPIVARGGVVIDNSSTYRLADGVPLIIPEVNGDAVTGEHRIFPVANCTAIVLCTALAPIARAAGLTSIRVATYQAASGAGRAGLEELLAQERTTTLREPQGDTDAVLRRAQHDTGDASVTPSNPSVTPSDPSVTLSDPSVTLSDPSVTLSSSKGGDVSPQPRVFPRVLARNVIPQIGNFDADGFSGEERKVAEETRKMLRIPDLFVSAITVRVPVLTAHAEAVFFETQRPTSVAELAAAYEGAPGVVFHRDGIITPREVEGQDDVHVARLRAEDASGTRFALWCVGDQLRKGAATNAVQILELLLQRGYLK